MANVTVHHLDKIWNDSHGEPLALFESNNPESEIGSYVIEPGERVPESGTTTHNGDEISVILTGELEIYTEDEQETVGSESMTVIPSGTPHYTENRGEQPARLIYAILGEI